MKKLPLDLRLHGRDIIVDCVRSMVERTEFLVMMPSILVIVLTAATNPTIGAAGWALHLLAQHQDIQSRLRRELEKIGAFVEEVLCQHGTTATSFRACTYDTQIASADVSALDSSNFDMEKWADSERFGIDKPNVRNHLSFGPGPYLCIANTLARKELDRWSNFSRPLRADRGWWSAGLASLNVPALLTLLLKLTRCAR